nr:hypothetical protein [Tanacetum cinerariifolium]
MLFVAVVGKLNPMNDVFFMFCYITMMWNLTIFFNWEIRSSSSGQICPVNDAVSTLNVGACVLGYNFVLHGAYGCILEEAYAIVAVEKMCNVWHNRIFITPAVPDITHLLYRHYFIGLLHKIREKAPLRDEVESSQEGRSKSGKSKVKKGKGKPNKKHLIIKLVCDEDNNKLELLVYMRYDKYYVIAFGVPRGKTYVFSDSE